MSQKTDTPKYDSYGVVATNPPTSYFHLEEIKDIAENYDWDFSPHSHSYLYQMIWVEQGAGVFSGDGKTVEFSDNWVVFIAPNTIHSIQFKPGTVGRSLYFTHDFLSLGYLGNMLHNFVGQINRPLCKWMTLPVAQRTPWKYHFKSLTQEFVNSTALGRNACIRAWLALLLTQFIRSEQHSRNQAETLKPMRSEQLVNRFVDLVEKHYITHRKAHFYADQLYVNVDTLNNHVRSSLGRTLGKVIRERIVLEAKRKLMYSDSTTSQIAGSLNFSDDSYFVRFFKREVGVTPYQYKKKQTKKTVP